MPLCGSKGAGGIACSHARDLLPTAIGPPRPISQPTRDPGRPHQHHGLRCAHQHHLLEKSKTRMPSGECISLTDIRTGMPSS